MKRSILLVVSLALTTLLSSFAQQTESDSFEYDLRTNLLYNIILTPTLDGKWHINPNWSIKADDSHTHWSGKHDMIHNIWLVNPETRWYVGNGKRFYLGIAGNVGRYNNYNDVISSLFFPHETGYRGGLYSDGLSVGYKLILNYVFLLDFNLGLGYNIFKYNSLTVHNSHYPIRRGCSKLQLQACEINNLYFIYKKTAMCLLI